MLEVLRVEGRWAGQQEGRSCSSRLLTQLSCTQMQARRCRPCLGTSETDQIAEITTSVWITRDGGARPAQESGDARQSNVILSAVCLLLNPQEFHTNCILLLSLSLRKELLSLGATSPAQRGIKSLPDSAPVVHLP